MSNLFLSLYYAVPVLPLPDVYAGDEAGFFNLVTLFQPQQPNPIRFFHHHRLLIMIERNKPHHSAQPYPIVSI